ncbi:hypothetical protein EON79_17770 [bacterium]|nr:MAG: hypothetical protein EON79_17770 [bacterium]
MTLLYHLLAREVLIDRETNTSSVIKVIERIGVRESQVPFESKSGTQWLHAPMTFLAVFRAEEDEGENPQFAVTMRTPDGTELPPLVRPVAFDGKPISRCTIFFPGVPNGGEGEYSVVMTYQDRTVVWPFSVSIVPATAPEGVRNDS